ncbi:UDP-N-acetylmuramoyl-L-alanyl-D-glutamate--2,6-diaminopimelate ligase [Bacillus salitolerans]|uniref:UDP-N-acetylmuramoyl-L-alanyl-D-glutamate--2,6-diaminopimelate ligase n=1 Tax=Bacillus salitolerans TaxID=1437434 RepID=A0ABW4LX52_9BACI
MKLRELADLILIKHTVGDMETIISGLQMDSRKIEKGNIFICVPAITGFLEDRHLFAEDAVKNGAAALVLERDVDVDIPKIFVKDARHAMAVMASHFFQYPSHELKLIGITGTNGKTTSSYILEKILDDFGYKTGLMGNNGIKIDGKQYPTDINTQEPPSLQKNLRLMRDRKTEYCVMEVSSQGLDMNRVSGCNFRTAVFTNLTQDHLDYHGTFEEYRYAKGLLFSKLGNTFNDRKNMKFAVLNADDPTTTYYRKLTSAEVVTYGITNQSDVMAKNITTTSQGTQFTLITFKGEIDVTLQLVGQFNVYNALAAVAASLIEGISLENIKNSLAELTSVTGRMEIVSHGQDYLVLVDYAHTPDALENVLKSINDFTTGKIITVFGCGGNRDVSKRPIMGEIASRYSDYLFVTSDNPRSEEPTNILRDIEKGIRSTTSYELIESREKAIQQAIQVASKGDVVLIAGKGHETYQQLKDKTIHFDDKEVAQKAIVQKQKL